jgi:hypothetical protein
MTPRSVGSVGRITVDSLRFLLLQCWFYFDRVLLLGRAMGDRVACIADRGSSSVSNVTGIDPTGCLGQAAEKIFRQYMQGQRPSVPQNPSPANEPSGGLTSTADPLQDYAAVHPAQLKLAQPGSQNSGSMVADTVSGAAPGAGSNAEPDKADMPPQRGTTALPGSATQGLAEKAGINDIANAAKVSEDASHPPEQTNTVSTAGRGGLSVSSLGSMLLFPDAPSRLSGAGLDEAKVTGRANPRISASGATVLGVAGGVTANFYDELRGFHEASDLPGWVDDLPLGGAVKIIGGAINVFTEQQQPHSITSLVTGDDSRGPYEKRYEAQRDFVRGLQNAAWEQHPGYYGGGEVAGAGATMAIPGTNVVRGGTMLARSFQAFGLGATYGGAAGIGFGTNTEERVTNGMTGAVTGGLTGAIASPLTELAVAGASKIANRISLAFKREIELPPPQPEVELPAPEAKPSEPSAAIDGTPAPRDGKQVARGESSVPKGGRAVGVASGRPFDPDVAGGPIEKLSTDGVRISHEGIDRVEQHLERFGPDDTDQAMVKRLRSIASGDVAPTEYDLNYYTHELREFERYTNLGWERGQPEGVDASYDLWNNAHTATLEDYGLKDNQLYHPDALK